MNCVQTESIIIFHFQESFIRVWIFFVRIGLKRFVDDAIRKGADVVSFAAESRPIDNRNCGTDNEAFIFSGGPDNIINISTRKEF
jgi:hypothetical protein